jgi:hypothetical protein
MKIIPLSFFVRPAARAGNPHGHVGSMRFKATKQHPLGTSDHGVFPLAMVIVLAASFGFNLAARAQDAPTASGGQGQAQSVGNNSHRRVTRWKQSDC